MKKTICYAEKRFFEWHEDDRSVTIREKGGSYGGGSEVLIVETLVFDASQITSKINGNHPTWGGPCHTLHNNADRAVVIISYQPTTGALTPGAHPGSYNGQDAYNDMLVTDDGTIMHGNRTGECRNNAGGVSNLDR